MTSTLDLPQHRYVCSPCGGPLNGILRCVDHPNGRVAVEPTLLRADFEAYVAELKAAHGSDVPPSWAIWDRLESCTDTAPSNREAIDNAIRWVVSQR